jgi:glycosyltransferase involved in cell wall biosynthesis
MGNASLWVVVPAFNEGPAVGAVAADLKTRYDNVVVVDDGSSDDTAARAKSAGAIVVRHHINLGQGAALQTGIDFVLRRGAATIATFDADGQHAPEDIAALAAALARNRADIALGSRFLGVTEGIGVWRRLVLKTAIVFQHWTTGLRLTDAHNGLRVMTASAARRIRIRQNRMAHASEIVAQIAALRLRVVEAPCTVRYSEYSRAKGQRLTGALRILFDLALRRLYR